MKADEAGEEPPLDGTSESRSTAPAVRVTEALAVAWVVHAPDHLRGHTDERTAAPRALEPTETDIRTCR